MQKIKKKIYFLLKDSVLLSHQCLPQLAFLPTYKIKSFFSINYIFIYKFKIKKIIFIVIQKFNKRFLKYFMRSMIRFFFFNIVTCLYFMTDPTIFFVEIFSYSKKNICPKLASKFLGVRLRNKINKCF